MFLLSFWTICSQNISIYSTGSSVKRLLIAESASEIFSEIQHIPQQSIGKIYNVIVEYHSETVAH